MDIKGYDAWKTKEPWEDSEVCGDCQQERGVPDAEIHWGKPCREHWAMAERERVEHEIDCLRDRMLEGEEIPF